MPSGFSGFAVSPALGGYRHGIPSDAMSMRGVLQASCQTMQIGQKLRSPRAWMDASAYG